MSINLNLFKITLAVYGGALLLMLAVPYFEQAIEKARVAQARPCSSGQVTNGCDTGLHLASGGNASEHGSPVSVKPRDL